MQELFETGKSARVRPDLQKRALVRLDALEATTGLESLHQPGFDFHALRGRPQRYSIHINGPWCLTFEWRDGIVLRLDLEQYH